MIGTSRLLAALLLLGLSGCSSLAPFQTVTPGVKPPPPASHDAMPVFGLPTAVSNPQMAEEEQQPASAAEAVAQGAAPAGAAAGAEAQGAPPAGTAAGASAQGKPPTGTAAGPEVQVTPPAGTTTASPAAGPAHPLAVCYSRLTASAEQVRSTAEAACPDGVLSFVGQGWNLNVCPLLTPVRAVFTCTPR